MLSDSVASDRVASMVSQIGERPEIQRIAADDRLFERQRVPHAAEPPEQPGAGAHDAQVVRIQAPARSRNVRGRGSRSAQSSQAEQAGGETVTLSCVFW